MKKILLADSTHALRRHLYTMIDRMGYEALSALTVKGAVEIIRTRKPDLILCSTQMKGESGFDLCRSLEDLPELRDIPIILVTTDPVSNKAPAELPDMIKRILCLPVGSRELYQAIREYLPSDDGCAGMRVPLKARVNFWDGNLHRSLITDSLDSEGCTFVKGAAEVRDRVLDIRLMLPGLKVPLSLRGRFLSIADGNGSDQEPAMKVEFSEVDPELVGIINIYLENYVAGAIFEPNGRSGSQGSSLAADYLDRVIRAI